MFGPALTLVLALVSSAVIAVPTVDNVYKRAVASLNPSSTELPFHFPESLNLGADDFKVFDSYTDAAGVTHVYGAHMLNGARIANHQAAAHVKNGQVTSFSSSFGTTPALCQTGSCNICTRSHSGLCKGVCYCFRPTGVSPFTLNLKHALEYVEQPDGKIVYAYKFQLRNNPVTKWVEVWCDATTGEGRPGR
ncbi:hypothetical protein BASA62_002745 [Batrachochytrium salamandrivorans]|nr:hypothetical protein BASA62_002745 [Batrachochytrium salamandrivorans]